MGNGGWGMGYGEWALVIPSYSQLLTPNSALPTGMAIANSVP
ncbi:hypothetical protein [Nostoc sp. KVJ20]|nr:hypothetical protein [Nostoc sp. KVJ20]